MLFSSLSLYNPANAFMISDNYDPDEAMNRSSPHEVPFPSRLVPVGTDHLVLPPIQVWVEDLPKASSEQELFALHNHYARQLLHNLAARPVYSFHLFRTFVNYLDRHIS